MSLKYHYIRITPACPCCGSNKVASFYKINDAKLFTYYFYIHLKNGEYIEPISEIENKENDFLCLQCFMEFEDVTETKFVNKTEFEQYLATKGITEDDIEQARKFWIESKTSKKIINRTMAKAIDKIKDSPIFKNIKGGKDKS